MSVKLVVLLIVISSLISYSRNWDDLCTESVSAADEMLAILSENTDPDEISKLVYRLKVKYQTRGFSFDSKYMSISHLNSILIKRGISHKFIEKKLFDALNELFGTEPTIEPLYVQYRPHYPLTLFAEYYVWHVKRGIGIPCRVSMRYIHRVDMPRYYFNKIPNLWLKPERIGVSLHIKHNNDDK